MPSFIPGSLISTESIKWLLEEPYNTDHIKEIIDLMPIKAHNSTSSSLLENTDDTYCKIFIPINFLLDIPNYIKIVSSSYIALSNLQYIGLYNSGGASLSPTHIIFYFHLEKDLDPTPEDIIKFIINKINILNNKGINTRTINTEIFVKESLS